MIEIAGEIVFLVVDVVYSCRESGFRGVKGQSNWV